MRWRRIARKDFMDAIRNRRLLGMIATFLLVGAGYGVVLDNTSGSAFAVGVFTLLSLLGPIVALSLAQHSIVGKRESGELAVLLGLPFSRRDVVLGTALGRTGVIALTLLATYFGAIVVGAVTGAGIAPRLLAGGFGVALVLGIVFVGLTVGISAATKSTSIASVGSFGLFLLFVLKLWIGIPYAVLFVTNDFSLPATEPEWVAAFGQLSPFAALRNAVEPLLPDLAGGFFLAAGSVPAEPPIYQQPAIATVAVLAWIVVPVAIGYWRFSNVDL
jgi:ABC-type transport system involved in multi-copper enzyme maturation permease subunit